MEKGIPFGESDAQVVRRSVTGEINAFGELFWRHGAAIHGYLSRRAGREVADDLVAEVWLRAFKGRSTFNPEFEDARPWLYGIARHVLLAHWRLQARNVPTMPLAIMDPWPNIEERLDSQERRAELEAALAELSEGERETLLLVAWEQLSAAEIAVVLDLPQSTIRNRLHRARTVMRSQLGETYHSSGQEQENWYE